MRTGNAAPARHSALEPDELFDLTGLLPPLPSQTDAQLLGGPARGNSAGHTYLPRLITAEVYERDVLPQLQQTLPAEMVKFIHTRVNETFRIRHTLRRLRDRIQAIVGQGNFSALWLDREAFSADSMEHRAVVTEAVIHVYSVKALGELVALLSENRIPMIPYGEGGGYNMGVTPMAPAVTISLRGMDYISAIRPSRRNGAKGEITVGAGVPFKDLQAYLANRGYVLRCDPNTPRAATGGIAATGSNGGRKVYEVILEGRAVIADGAAVRFALDQRESDCIDSEPFLMANKFFSVREPQAFARQASAARARRTPPTPSRACGNLVIPLVGMKAAASMLAQQHEQRAHAPGEVDRLADETPFPLSAFVGAEGTTGFIYEVTFEVERPRDWILGARLHFTDVAAAMAVTRAIKSRGSEAEPEYFEVITGASIRRFLLQDFPGVFSPQDEAVLFVGVEGHTDAEARERMNAIRRQAAAALGELHLASHLARFDETHPELQREGRDHFERMIRPRELLPKKLRTKCKTDMEIRTEYLADVLKLVQQTPVADTRFQKEDVMFGHLTPRKTAIIHWNIGGFDLYSEEAAHAAWDYLEQVIGKAQHLSHTTDPLPSAAFSGEHGIAGKAAFLWLNHLEPAEFERMCQIKDSLDPQGLFNPETLFLRTSVSRALRARLIAFAQRAVDSGLSKGEARGTPTAADIQLNTSLDFATQEALRCTRCNACKVCPVIDAEHELRRENPRSASSPVLPSKRNLVMFLEWVASLRMGSRAGSLAAGEHAAGAHPQDSGVRAMFKEAAALLSKCFYCRKCDKACPVDINIHPMVRAFQEAGGVPHRSSVLFRFLYERLMGEDFFKDWTYKAAGLIILISQPLFKLARQIRAVPDWLKSYLSPPQFQLQAYEPARAGTRVDARDNFVLVHGSSAPLYGTEAYRPAQPAGEADTIDIFIRYRGCMDTYANPQATSAVDTYFRTYLGVAIVDLEKKLCCGFPFEADGLHERARRSQFISLSEIAKAIASVRSRIGRETQLRFTVFSNCPTCVEAIKEMKEITGDPEQRERLRVSAGLPVGFQWNLLGFEVRDTAEIATDLLRRLEAAGAAGTDLRQRLGLKSLKSAVPKTVGLKVPCHNTTAATAAQLELLRMHYTAVESYDRCCGLSGTGRLKHPRIGTKIAEKLFEQIRAAPAEAVVSGCPSCRDGVVIQRNILQGRQDPLGRFEVSGIFQQILSDH